MYIVTLPSSFCGRRYGVCAWLSDIMIPDLTIYIVPSIMVAWGIVMTLMSLVKSFEGLVVCVLFGPHANLSHLTHHPPSTEHAFSLA